MNGNHCMPELIFESLIRSIVQTWKDAKRLGCLSISLVMMALPLPVCASLPEIQLSAQSIEYEEYRLEELRMDLGSEGRFHIHAGRVKLEGLEPVLSDFELDGSVDELTLGDETSRLKVRFRSGIFEASADVMIDPDGFMADFRSAEIQLPELKGLEVMPPEAAWLSRGVLDTDIRIAGRADQQPELSFQLGVRDLAFDSPDGRIAGEALELKVGGTVRRGDELEIRIDGVVESGEVLIDAFYRDFSNAGLEFRVEPEWRDKTLQAVEFYLTDSDSLTVEGRLQQKEENAPGAWLLQVNRVDLSFPGAYRRYIEPMAASWTLNGLEVTGRVSWNGEWLGGEFISGDLNISDLTIVDTLRSRFAFTGLDARLRPGDHAYDSNLSWRGLLFGRINLGAGEASLDSEPGTLALLKPLTLNVLGGRLQLDNLRFALPGSSAYGEREADIHMEASLQELDIKQLTAALGWPSFSGTLSGEIPGARLRDGVLEVDGEIMVRVFDGVVSVGDLRVERLFGVLPSLAANVDASNLDLELLTGTFSFGKISGRLDGYVHGLRMLDWKPVAFDAWFGTPERQSGSNGISRQAVNNLTTLGGGRATTALTGPLMRLFNKFSYRRLGLGCKLQNNVCEVRGISEDDVSVLILEGAGVPKITIRAFNRQTDWPQLVAELLAVSGEESIRIGEAPEG